MSERASPGDILDEEPAKTIAKDGKRVDLPPTRWVVVDAVTVHGDDCSSHYYRVSEQREQGGQWVHRQYLVANPDTDDWCEVPDNEACGSQELEYWVRRNDFGYLFDTDTPDDSWAKEIAHQAGMGLGIQAYNDHMGCSVAFEEWS